MTPSKTNPWDEYRRAYEAERLAWIEARTTEHDPQEAKARAERASEIAARALKTAWAYTDAKVASILYLGGRHDDA